MEGKRKKGRKGSGRGEGEARHLGYKCRVWSDNVLFGSGAFPAALFTHLLRQRLLSLAGQPPHLVSRNKAFVSFGYRAPLLPLLPSSSFFLGAVSFVKPSPLQPLFGSPTLPHSLNLSSASHLNLSVPLVLDSFFFCLCLSPILFTYHLILLSFFIRIL